MDDIIILGGPEPAELTPAQSGKRRVLDRFTPEQVDRATTLWESGESRQAVAGYLGITVATLSEFTNYGQLRHFSRRQGRGGGRPRGWKRAASNASLGHRDPTPAQIRERSAEIRKTWSIEDAAIRSARMGPPDGASLRDSIRSSGIRVIPVSAIMNR